MQLVKGKNERIQF